MRGYGMPDKALITIGVSAQKRAHIEDVARQAGYEDPGDYLLALFEAREQHTERTKEALLASLKAGIEDAIAGRTQPIDDLWVLLDEEDE